MKKTKAIISFEKSFLQKLVDEGNWCVELREQTYHLALHPYHLTNINNSIKDLLGKGIARYDPKLNGILLGFENIKLLSQGTIVDDSFFVHIDVSANFFLFKPEIGKVLIGVVNKKSDDHVGCLVYETFNVSIPKPEDQEISEWMGGKVEIGDEISFKITFHELDSRLPYIRGELLTNLNKNASEEFEDDETPKKKSKKKKKDAENVEVDREYKKSKRKTKDTSLEESNKSNNKERMVNGYAEDNEDSYKKKKKKGKRALDESIDEFSSSRNDSLLQLNETIGDGLNKKKKKHRRSLDENVDEVVEDTVFKKKKKKHKRSLGESIDESLQLDESNEVIGEGSHKKKKRKRSLEESVVESSVVKKKKHKHSLNESIDEFSRSKDDKLLQDFKKKKHKHALDDDSPEKKHSFDESFDKYNSSKHASLSQTNENYGEMDNDAPRRKKKRKKDK
ncbi:hypothetical protein FQR65_LT03577 [Abscondita terminalis]|nr:hypothetical protein FQR65_LT03577 [Abscondita terminalis]